MNGGVLIQSPGSLVTAFTVRSLRVAPYECARCRLLASRAVRMTEEGWTAIYVRCISVVGSVGRRRNAEESVYRVASIQVAAASSRRATFHRSSSRSPSNRSSSCVLFSSFQPLFIPFLPAHRCNLWTASGRRRDREDREGRPDKSLVVKRGDRAKAKGDKGGGSILCLTRVAGWESYTIFDAGIPSDPTMEGFPFLSPRESFSSDKIGLKFFRWLAVIFRVGNFHKTEMEFKIRGNLNSEVGEYDWFKGRAAKKFGWDRRARSCSRSSEFRVPIKRKMEISKSLFSFLACLYSSFYVLLLFVPREFYCCSSIVCAIVALQCPKCLNLFLKDEFYCNSLVIQEIFV